MNWAEYFQILVLGIVQGISEFLPISSDGHLVIAQAILNATMPPVFSSKGDLERIVALHIGTTAALFLFYFRDLIGLLKQPRMCALIFVATIPAVIVGLCFDDWLESTFQSPIFAGFGLLVTAALLFMGQNYDSGKREANGLTFLDAVIIGCFQAMAPLPGVSRSGSTISGGLLLGLERNFAARFSFLMAVPVTAGAIALKMKDAWEKGATETAIPVLIFGILTSFVVGILALKALIALIPRRKLNWMAAYCVLVGLIVIGWQCTLPTPPTPANLASPMNIEAEG